MSAKKDGLVNVGGFLCTNDDGLAQQEENLLFGEHAHMDLVRLAIPRRVYTQSHIDYVVEVILEVWKHRHRIRGLKLTYEQPFLRHFTARLEPA